MLEVTLCLEIMRHKIKATNELLWSMFLSHDLGPGSNSKVKIKIKIMTCLQH
jgi:hypothetical protein